MFLFKKCNHAKMPVSVKRGYCPECGEYVENRWFITRCPVCGKRHKTMIKGGYPVPVEKFCSNCGESKFIVEEIDYPDVVSINYAAYKTVTLKQQNTEKISAWIENAGKINLLNLIPA